MLTAVDLSELIPAAKNGDSIAITLLCERFKPLVFKLCHRQTLFNVLKQFYCQHKSLEEISFSMNIAPRTVRHHRQAGLRNLRSRLHCIIE